MRALVAAAAAALALLVLAPVGGAVPSPTRWCGTAESAADLPDTLNNAKQIHVVYAYPSDGTNRFAQLSLGIARDIAAIDTWWRAQDSSRAPRWDLASFPGCDTQYGQLDISVVKLPRPTGYYADLNQVLGRLSDDLAAEPTSFDDPDKKYVVLYDGLLNQPNKRFSICGLSPTTVLGGGADAYAGIFLMSPCGDGLGGASYTAGTIAHELIHNLGALQRSGPPNACASSPGHPCDADNDVLSPSGEYGEILTTLQLDVGRNDYYGHSGSWWDVQDSPFLEHVGQTFALPSGPSSLKASNDGGNVEIDWTPATSPNGAITYRVYRDGVLQGITTGQSGVSDKVEPLSTHTWEIRAEDALGYLGPSQTIKYTLTAAAAATTAGGSASGSSSGSSGLGVGQPGQVAALKLKRTATGIVLSWAKPGGGVTLGMYWVKRNGALYAQVRKGTTLAVPKAKAAGVWTVTAVGIEGIAGKPSAPLKVS